MPVTVQLSAQGDIVSEVIRDFTRTWCSHVDAVWPDSRLLGARSDVCAGVASGVQLRPAGYAAFVRTERITFAATAAQEADFYDFLGQQVGKPYDKLAVLGLGIDRDWRSDDKWFCSELVMAALEHAGIVGKITSPVTFISPRDILLLGEALQLAA
jgi:uncharacterized protein YycO